jgi:hypothetical protein
MADRKHHPFFFRQLMQLMITTSLPPHFLGEAVPASTYNINIQPLAAM